MFEFNNKKKIIILNKCDLAEEQENNDETK